MLPATLERILLWLYIATLMVCSLWDSYRISQLEKIVVKMQMASDLPEKGE
jgi:hypothetical protein